MTIERCFLDYLRAKKRVQEDYQSGLDQVEIRLVRDVEDHEESGVWRVMVDGSGFNKGSYSECAKVFLSIMESRYKDDPYKFEIDEEGHMLVKKSGYVYETVWMEKCE